MNNRKYPRLGKAIVLFGCLPMVLLFILIVAIGIFTSEAPKPVKNVADIPGVKGPKEIAIAKGKADCAKLRAALEDFNGAVREHQSMLIAGALLLETGDNTLTERVIKKMENAVMLILVLTERNPAFLDASVAVETKLKAARKATLGAAGCATKKL